MQVFSGYTIFPSPLPATNLCSLWNVASSRVGALNQWIKWIHNNVGTRQRMGRKFRRGTQRIQKKLQASIQNMPLHLVAWRLWLSPADIILVYVLNRLFSLDEVDVGTRKDKSRYLLVAGKAWSRKGFLRTEMRSRISQCLLGLLFQFSTNYGEVAINREYDGRWVIRQVTIQLTGHWILLHQFELFTCKLCIAGLLTSFFWPSIALSQSKKHSINDTTLTMPLSIFRFQPCRIRVEDSNVAKGPDVRESWRGVQSCSGRCEEE